MIRLGVSMYAACTSGLYLLFSLTYMIAPEMDLTWRVFLCLGCMAQFSLIACMLMRDMFYRAPDPAMSRAARDRRPVRRGDAETLAGAARGPCS